VAESSDKQILAIAQLKKHKDETVELASLVVEAEFRDKGLARKLVEELVKDEVEPIYLMCRFGLGDFYSRFDFVEAKINDMPRYFRLMKKVVKVFTLVSGRKEHLLIMKRNP